MVESVVTIFCTTAGFFTLLYTVYSFFAYKNRQLDLRNTDRIDEVEKELKLKITELEQRLNMANMKGFE